MYMSSSSSNSIPVSRTEFMRLISRIEQLEAEISMFRKWMEKACKSNILEMDGEDKSDDEIVIEFSKSHKKLLTKKHPSNTQ